MSFSDLGTERILFFVCNEGGGELVRGLQCLQIVVMASVGSTCCPFGITSKSLLGKKLELLKTSVLVCSAEFTLHPLKR